MEALRSCDRGASSLAASCSGQRPARAPALLQRALHQRWGPQASGSSSLVAAPTPRQAAIAAGSSGHEATSSSLNVRSGQRLAGQQEQWASGLQAQHLDRECSEALSSAQGLLQGTQSQAHGASTHSGALEAQLREALGCGRQLLQSLADLLGPGVVSQGRPHPLGAPDRASPPRPLLQVAALLPALSAQLLTVRDIEAAYGSACSSLAREALLVQRAAVEEASEDARELVDWCLANCSAHAALLAAVWWGEQGAHTGSAGQFFALLRRQLGLGLGLSGSCTPHSLCAAAAASSTRLVPRVMCTSISSARGSGPSLSSLDLVTEEEGSGPGGDVDSSLVLKAAPLSEAAVAQGVASNGSPSRGHDGSALGSNGAHRGSNGRSAGSAQGSSHRAFTQSSASAGHAQQPHRQPEAAAASQPAPSSGSQSSAAGHHQRGAQHASSSGAAPQAGSGAAGGSGGSGGRLDVPPPASPSQRAGRSRGRSRAMSSTGSMGSGGSMGSADDLMPGSRISDDSSEDDAQLASAKPQPKASLMQRPSRLPKPAGAAAPPPLAGADGQQQPGVAESGDYAAASGASIDLMQSLPDLDRLPSMATYTPMRLVPVGATRLVDPDTRQPLPPGGLDLPALGPFLLSNCARAFPATDAVLGFDPQVGQDEAGQQRHDDAWRHLRLAVRFEYIAGDLDSGDVTLQLFNLSRTLRGRVADSAVYVSGRPLLVGDPGLVLSPGDEVAIGPAGGGGGDGDAPALLLRVEAAAAPPSAVQAALVNYCGGVDGGDAPQPGSASSAPPSGAVITALANLSRKDPARAVAAVRPLAAAHPQAAALWLVWAQAAARLGRATQARRLFRAAVEAAVALPPDASGQALPAALAASSRRSLGLSASTNGPAATAAAAAAASAAAARLGQQQPGSSTALPLSTQGTYSESEDEADDAPSPPPLPASPPPQPFATVAPQQQAGPGHNWLLVQALGNWGKLEWRLRYYGAARHLWRAALDEAGRHPQGAAGGGGGPLLHYWASQEYERLNIRNARIVVGEALRKCPDDVGLYVLAAGVELEGGHLDLAKAFCTKAYELERTNKHLYLIWPRVCAALGDRIKARLLYERGLDHHPRNTKIMASYARFCAEEGDLRGARELLVRALNVDPSSAGPGMAARLAWVALEGALGNTRLARQLLEEGLELHPHHPGAAVAAARLLRLEGRLGEAAVAARSAERLLASTGGGGPGPGSGGLGAGACGAGGALLLGGGPPAEELLSERVQLMRALGESELAANLARHLQAHRRMGAAKRAGYWGSEAWRAYYAELADSAEARGAVVAARRRRRELGWLPARKGPGGGRGPPPRGADGGAPPGTGRRHSSAEEEQWRAREELATAARAARAAAAEAARAARVAALRAARLAAGESAEALDAEAAEAAAEAAAAAVDSSGYADAGYGGRDDGDDGDVDGYGDPLDPSSAGVPGVSNAEEGDGGFGDLLPTASADDREMARLVEAQAAAAAGVAQAARPAGRRQTAGGSMDEEEDGDGEPGVPVVGKRRAGGAGGGGAGRRQQA